MDFTVCILSISGHLVRLVLCKVYGGYTWLDRHLNWILILNFIGLVGSVEQGIVLYGPRIITVRLKRDDGHSLTPFWEGDQTLKDQQYCLMLPKVTKGSIRKRSKSFIVEGSHLHYVGGNIKKSPRLLFCSITTSMSACYSYALMHWLIFPNATWINKR